MYGGARFGPGERARDLLHNEVEGRVEEHSRMVEDVSGRFTNLEGKVDRLREEMSTTRRDQDGKMQSYFTWMVGVALAAWLSTAWQIHHLAR